MATKHDEIVLRPIELVVGFDGSPSACSALETAKNLALGRNCSITVVYVSAPTAMDSLAWEPGTPALLDARRHNEDAISQELQEVASSVIGAANLNWHFNHRRGTVGHELVGAADEIRADAQDRARPRIMVLVGSTDRSRDRLFGSIPHGLSRQNRYALAIVPSD
ncbi:universal stress protein [uncultured Jatrophihabitans sp.]|uniref:universal stress protein n=1 Tax=uncultured Jatrophihabitans sp. TaxID=1610747 RepID=UPI0035C9B983